MRCNLCGKEMCLRYDPATEETWWECNTCGPNGAIDRDALMVGDEPEEQDEVLEGLNNEWPG